MSLSGLDLEHLYHSMPAAGIGDIANMLKEGQVCGFREIVQFYQHYKNQSDNTPFLLVSLPFSMVVRRESLDVGIQQLPFERLAGLSRDRLSSLIDYQRSFTGLPRYTYNMSTLSLAAALISVSNGRFPFAYLDAAGEAVLGRSQICCYPIYEYPNGDLVVRYGLTSEAIKSKIKEICPGVIGINCPTSSHHSDMMDVVGIAKEVEKETNKRITVVVGGSHPTALDEYLARKPSVDIVVRGEGEVTLLELLYRLLTKQHYDDVRGISFCKKHRFVKNPDRAFVNVDYLPWLARELAPKRKTKDGTSLSAVSVYGLWHNGLLDGNGTVIMTSRGCWGSKEVCYNCFAGHMFGRLRSRSKKNVLAELEYLAEQGYTIISDDADQVVLPTDEFKWYCQEVIARGLNKKLKFITPNGLWLDGLWALGEDGRRLMVKAGYTDLCIGLEGADNFVKNVLHKPIKLEHAEDVLRSFRHISAELAVPVYMTTFVMIGGPGCSRKEIDETYAFVKNLKTRGLIDQVLPFISSIIPGSRFFDIFIERLDNHTKPEEGMGIFEGVISSAEEARCLDALGDVGRGEITSLLDCFDCYHVWEKMRFGLPNFHRVFDQDSVYLSSMGERLNSLNEWFKDKRIVRRA